MVWYFVNSNEQLFDKIFVIVILKKNSLLRNRASFLLNHLMKLALQYSKSYKEKLGLKIFTLGWRVGFNDSAFVSVKKRTPAP